MHSMTGFGVGEAPLGEGRLTLELRALNHRFLEVKLRLPWNDAAIDMNVTQLVRGSIGELTWTPDSRGITAITAPQT